MSPAIHYAAPTALEWRIGAMCTEMMRRARRKSGGHREGNVKNARLKEKAGGRYKFKDNGNRAGGTPAYRQARRYLEQALRLRVMRMEMQERARHAVPLRTATRRGRD